MAAADDHLFALSLQFTYHHALGDRAPFFEGLEQGRTVVTECPLCRRRWFPPRLTCTHDGAATKWRDATPTGVVEAVTDGPSAVPLDGPEGHLVFALVRLDGCSNRALARLEGADPVSAHGCRVVLALSTEAVGHPVHKLVFRPLVSTP